MIGYIFGKIKSIKDSNIILLTNGVGYEVYCGLTAKKYLVNEDLELWVYTYVREDQFKLFGFPSPEHRELFILLNGISGVGPKTAYAIVELFSPPQLAQLVGNNDIRALQSVPGIGRKTAERLMLELEGKLDKMDLVPVSSSEVLQAGSGVWGELREGLMTLGFPEIKINRVVNLLKREKTEWTIEEVMAQALRKINT